MRFFRRDVPFKAYAYLSLGVALVISTLLLFASLVDEILEREIMLWDKWMYFVLQSYASYPLDVLMYWMTAMGSALSVVGLSVAMLLWLGVIKRDLRAVYLFLIANGGGLAFNLLLKVILQRDRPSVNADIGAVGYSLPSGHAMGAMIFYGFMAYLIIRSQRDKMLKLSLTSLMILFVALIGVSRVYLNAHYASDVLAGFIAGSFWLSACVLALEARPFYRKYWTSDSSDEPRLPG